MFKKALSILLISCVIVVSLAACKGNDKKNSASATVKTTSSPAKTTGSKASSTATAASTQGTAQAASASPTSNVSNGVVTEYSIDLDFQIKNFCAGIVFGYVDETNFLMWQVNTNDYGDNPDKEIPQAEKKVYFRPHSWSAGTVSVITETDISNAIKWENGYKTNHMKITVSAANEVKTYINNVLVDTYTSDLAAYGKFGFRQTSSVCEDEAYFDNIVITNTANNQVLLKYDFNSGENPFAEGEIIKGAMGDSNALYMKDLATDICVLE